MDKTQLSLAGEFAVLSQLALRGFDANLTLGNTKGVDILVSNSESGKMFRVEVKTNGRNRPSKSTLFGEHYHWIMGRKHEDIEDENLYFCFVIIGENGKNNRYFIVPNNIVSKYVKDEHMFWLNSKEKSEYKDINDIREFRIGLDEGPKGLDTPSCKQYEDNWMFN